LEKFETVSVSQNTLENTGSSTHVVVLTYALPTNARMLKIGVRIYVRTASQCYVRTANLRAHC